MGKAAVALKRPGEAADRNQQTKPEQRVSKGKKGRNPAVMWHPRPKGEEKLWPHRTLRAGVRLI